MTERCHSMEELERLDALPPQDPARSHLERCARCQAGLLTLRSFLADTIREPGARPDDARRDLDRFIARRFGEKRSQPARPWWRTARVSWFLLAPAAAVLVFALSLDGLRPPSNRPVLRGGADEGRPVLHEPAVSPGGELTLRWSGVPAATGYQVRVYSAGLKPVHTSGILTDTLLVIPDPHGTLRASPGSELLWRVAVLRGTREVAISGVRPFHLE